MKKLSAYGYRGDNIEQRYDGLKFDGKIAFNKLTDVYHAAVGHSEGPTQPSSRARYEYLCDPVRGRIWQSLSAILPGCGL